MPRTLLVVEDEPSIAELVRLILEGAGHRVTVAGDGWAALRRLGEAPYDLVVSDVMLPFLDGVALARAMQADPALRATPLVLMSAGHVAAVGVAPHAAFLRKPFDLEEFLAIVGRLLGPDPGAR